MNPIILDSHFVKTVITNSNDTLLIVFNQLGSSSHNDTNILYSLIPIIVAIIGGIFAIHQVRGNTISNARITWIENFRKSIAEYCMNSEKTIMQILNMDFKSKEKKQRFYDGFYIDNDVYVQYSSESTKYSLLIKLYLNLEEEKPKRIKKLIDIIDQDLAECYGSAYRDKYEFKIKDNLKEITRLSNIIIKEEWEKAKSYLPSSSNEI